MTATPSYRLPLPTFLIIGAQKSATRWLRLNLGQHPQIFAAQEECQFFSNDLFFKGRSVGWYRRRFEGWAGEPFVGEATPGYMMWRHRPSVMVDRISALLPDVRLIAILRNPIDRAQSAMVHHIRRGRIAADARLVDLVRDVPPEKHRLGLVAGGWYAASLRPYRDRFGDQLLVQLHDDIKTSEREVYLEAVRHVGASDDFVPAGLGEVQFSNQAKPRFEQAPLSVDERRELFAYFRDDVRQLEELIGRDLSRWDPDASAPAPASPPSDTPTSESSERRVS
jgi:hypothetical protein